MSEIKSVQVGQIWRCNDGAELRVWDVGYGVVTFEHRNASNGGAGAWVSNMTPANGWELVSDVGCATCKGDPEVFGCPCDVPAPAPEVRVGQVWKDRCGAGLDVRIVEGMDGRFAKGIDARGNDRLVSGELPYWTLISDAPEAKREGHTDECLNYDGGACVCTPAPEAADDGEDSVCDCGSRTGEPHIGCGLGPKPDPCAVKNNPCGLCGKWGSHEKHCRANCAAAIAALPVSGEFVASRVASGNSLDANWEGRDAAKADLRRKLSTLRAWPTCPVDGTPYGVEASVREERKDHLGSVSVFAQQRRETLKLWQARCVCKGCGR